MQISTSRVLHLLLVIPLLATLRAYENQMDLYLIPKFMASRLVTLDSVTSIGVTVVLSSKGIHPVVTSFALLCSKSFLTLSTKDFNTERR